LNARAQLQTFLYQCYQNCFYTPMNSRQNRAHKLLFSQKRDRQTNLACDSGPVVLLAGLIASWSVHRVTNVGHKTAEISQFLPNLHILGDSGPSLLQIWAKFYTRQ